VSRDIAVLFSRTFVTRWGGDQPHGPAASTPRKDPLPIVQGAGWLQGWSGREENLVPTGIRSQTVQPLVPFTFTYFTYIPCFLPLRLSFLSVCLSLCAIYIVIVIYYSARRICVCRI